MLGLGLSAYVPIVVLVLVIPISLLTAFYNVLIGLSYLVFFIPLQNILQKLHAYPVGKDFVDILVVSIIVGCIISRNKNETTIFEPTRLNLPIFLYILFSFVGLWVGSFYLGLDIPLSTHDRRLLDWKNLILLPILYFSTVNAIRDKKGVYLLLATILFSILFMDWFFYREFRWIKRVHYSHSLRIAGAFYYLGPNELGTFFTQSFLFTLAIFLFAKRRILKILLALLTAFNLYCLLYSFSRAAYLSGVVGVCFILFFARKKLLPFFVLICLLAPQVLPTSVWERIDMTFLSENEKVELAEKDPEMDDATFDPSAQGRFELWRQAFDLFKTNPVLGCGFRSYSTIYGFDTHNNYVKVLAELGIVGFCLYLYLYYLAFNSGWRLYQTSGDPYFRGLGIGFAACVIANMICNVTHDSWSYINLMAHYWVLFGLVDMAHKFDIQYEQKDTP